MRYFVGFIIGLFIAVVLYNSSDDTTTCSVIGQPEQMEVIYIPDIADFNMNKHKLLIDSKEAIK